MQPNYYAIIPASVRYADINPNAKLLYGEITALANKEGYCWASNQYFAKLYGVHEDTISNWVSILNKEGFIIVTINNGTQRQISLTTSVGEKTYSKSIKILESGRQKDLPPPAETPTTGRQKDRHNNTVNNTSNTGEQSSQKFEIVSEDDSPKREKKPRRVTPEVRAVFDLFGKDCYHLLGIRKQEVEAAIFLKDNFSTETLKSAISYIKENEDNEMFFSVHSPYDLRIKWKKLKAHKAKHN